MKKLALALLLISFAMSVPAQKLLDLYKKGTIRLIPDDSYAQGNNWNKVFSSYYDTLYGKAIGQRKSLILMPDASVVVNNAYRNYYTLFSPTGKFEKEFGITGKDGKQMKKIKKIDGIIDNKIFFTDLDNMGNMTCFDFDGNYIKNLKLDYSDKQMISLPNNKIAVVGWVIWDTKIRDFVAIVDYESNQQKDIWEHFNDICFNEFGNSSGNAHCDLFSYQYYFKEGGGISFNTMPFTNPTGYNLAPQIACSGNKLIVAIPGTGEIMVFDLEGKLISKDKIGWATNYLSVKEQREIQQKAIDKFKNTKEPKFLNWVSAEESKKAQESLVKDMEADMAKIKDPIPIPVFSTIIKDSDGNLLFFEYPKEEYANKFNVWIYNDGGKFVCQSSFVSDDYNLEINPSKMVFHDGYIYGLQSLKNANGVPLRLVRFKLTND